MTRHIALVGFGLAGSVFHAPLIAATPGLRLAYVVTSSAERAASVHRNYPTAEVLASTDELWSVADRIDAVVIASPNASHVPLALSALEHGVGVVVDKPLAATSAGGQSVVDLAIERGLFCTVFQNRRWDGDFATVRQLIADGELGRVHRFESRFERWRPEVDHSRWRESAAPDQAGGLLYDLGSHLVDQAVVAFGPVASVYAEVGARRAGAGVDDDIFIALQHAAGTVSHLWASALTAQLGPRFRVLGDRAAYVSHGLDPQEDQLRAGLGPDDPGFGVTDEVRWGTVGAGDQLAAHPTLPGRYGDFYTGAAQALDGAGPVPVDPADSVAVLRILEAARHSASDSAVIHLDA